MLCYHCRYASNCSIFRELYRASNDFCINECKNYKDTKEYKYQKIAEHDDLMHLIYDYFTGKVEGGYSEEDIKTAITIAMINL